MITTPRVSVIIATYNRAALLMAAIQSVLQQSFRDLEVIVADDGSTDNTAGRVASLDGPVTYIRLPHSNRLGRVRNEALRRARGELVAVLDDDDSWEPEKLARQVSVLDARPEIGVVHCGFTVLDEKGNHVPELAPWAAAAGPFFDRLVLRGCFIHPSTVLVRRALVDGIGGWNEERFPCEDYDLLLRLAACTECACVTEPLARLRFVGDRSSIRNEQLIYAQAISILEHWLGDEQHGSRRRLDYGKALARLHLDAAAVARRGSDSRAARRHLVAAIRSNPLDRAAWQAVVRR